MRRPLTLILCLSILALVAGCGGDDDEGEETGAEATTEETAEAPSDPSVFDTDPCALLTDADVEALLGKPAKGVLKNEGDAKTQQPATCLWELTKKIDLTSPSDRPFSVVVSAGDQAWYDNNLLLSQTDESFEELDGIADAAFAGDTRGGFLAGPAGITADLGIAVQPSSHEIAIDALERVYANYEG